MPDSIRPESQPTQAIPSELRILIVEDVPEDVELITLALEEAHIPYTYDVVDSLAACIDQLNQQTYDVILSDYRLPGLHAPEVLATVQHYQPLIPFILVTGSLGEEAAVDCIKAGMTDYVLKDRLYRLPTVLHRALNEANLRRQQQAAIAQIQQQAWRESILNQTIQAMRETLVPEEIMQTLVDHLHHALEVDGCCVLQSSHDGRMLIRYVSQASRGFDAFLGQPCVLWNRYKVELQQQGQLVLNTPDWQDNGAITELIKTLGTQTLVAGLLRYQTTEYGVLMVHHTQGPRQWTPSELSLLRAVAEQAAIAIYQVELYQRARQEVMQRRRVEDQLRYDTFHDTLTGLPNRALFLDRLNHALQIAQRPPDPKNGSSGNGSTSGTPRSFAVLFLDLDNFRMVNDSLGHGAGDFLLQVVSDRLQHCLRSGDTLARISGDEFAILLEDITGIDDILRIIETIHSGLRQSILLESQEVFVSACIGIVLNSDDYSDASQFLRDADTAMYQAKRKGRSQYQVFNESMHTQVRQRLQVENNLRRALSRGELTVVYQPVLHLPTQTLCGFEALVRWRDPVLGLRQPSQFIPIAEQTGLILPIGQWVLQEACCQLQRWRSTWPQVDELHVAVNLSAQQFAQPDLIPQVDAALAMSHLDQRHLRLEITESALIANEEIADQALRHLRQRQIQVAMDDFGTGYSSLSYLLRFPKDVLKIDKSFVSHLEENLDHQEIIRTILSLGNNLGLEVVAEGIQTAEQFKFLLDNGCLYGQGYWFYPPLTVPEVENLLTTAYGAR
jgi:diguanylate cyclase (GGDEF)-like protein